MKVAGPMPVFCAELRPLVRDGAKTQTRRVINPQPPSGYLLRDQPGRDGDAVWKNPVLDHCVAAIRPPCRPGEIRYFKEPLIRHREANGKWCAYYADTNEPVIQNIEGEQVRIRWRWKVNTLVRWSIPRCSPVRIPWRWKVNTLSSLFMPAEYARTFCEITEVRVERLQEITEEDAMNEGMVKIANVNMPYSFRGGFAYVWDCLNLKRGYPWSNNPFVWVLSWKLVKV